MSFWGEEYLGWVAVEMGLWVRVVDTMRGDVWEAMEGDITVVSGRDSDEKGSLRNSEELVDGTFDLAEAS